MDQDWHTVVLSKTRSGPKTKQDKNEAVIQARRAGAVVTEKKYSAGSNKSTHAPAINLKKLDEETEKLEHSRVDRTLSQAIQQARLSKKMTQKQLATMINEKPQVVNEYESGKALPNPQIISKIEKSLGTKLPRAKKPSAKK
mmetsp:Transcript_2558/g.3786  ORF Transcript_2558/g.3786 Transcript_2558/m.3786 type:complete len:142 (+) Transcript_2558:77-502(+)